MSHCLGECKSFPPFYEWNKCEFVEKDFCLKGRKSLVEPESLWCTCQPDPAWVPVSSSVKSVSLEIGGSCRCWGDRWGKKRRKKHLEWFLTYSRHAHIIAHCYCLQYPRAPLSGVQQSVFIVSMALSLKACQCLIWALKQNSFGSSWWIQVPASTSSVLLSSPWRLSSAPGLLGELPILPWNGAQGSLPSTAAQTWLLVKPGRSVKRLSATLTSSLHQLIPSSLDQGGE